MSENDHAAENSLPKGGPDAAQIQAAADEVSRAETELRRLRQRYGELLRQAARQLETARGVSVGEVLDGTERIVKKYPLPSVVFAGIIGIFLGRLFRRK
jgi:ElaB/YqjD/DUF883 family membrane-anchored ribosome-binding protein